MTLREWLKSTGTSQTAFAKDIKSTQPDIARYSAGKRLPSKAKMHRIYEATGGRVDANAFYGLPSRGCECPQDGAGA